VPLGELLVAAYQRYGLHCDTITFIPLHELRQRHRGYNQAQLLAEQCSQALSLPLQPLLSRVKNTPVQTRLSAAQRQQNVVGAFHLLPAARQALQGRNILLIDDVCTTGSTMNACALPLFAHGARAVWGLVLARHL
jgi:ComF family protein